VLGGFVLASTAATDAALALCRTLNVKPMFVGPMANSYGLELAGVLPSHARYDYRNSLVEAQALILSRLNPAVDPVVAERLAAMELLVVHSEFLTATAEIAHVVLPAVTGFEKEGSIINLEGRVLPVRAAPVEAGEAVDFTGVVKALGLALGQRLEGRSVKSARRILKRSLNLDLEELPDLGIWAPIKRGSARVALHTHEPPRSGNTLRTPSMLRYELASQNPALMAVHGVKALSLNPEDALEQRLREGDEISLPIGGIPYRLVVRVSESLPRGLMALPASADEPVGVVNADLKRASVERRALGVA